MYLKRQRKRITVSKVNTSTLANISNTRVWEEITNKVNTLGNSKGGVIEVKDKWRAMVSSPKKELNKCASSRKKTWEERKPESPMGTTVKIIELFEKDPSFSGISGGIDSSREPRKNVMELCRKKKSYIVQRYLVFG